MNRTFVLFCTLMALVIGYIATANHYNTLNQYGTSAQNERVDIKKQQKQYKEIDENLAAITQKKELRINPTQSYNYLKKEDIYNIRKKYVSTSIFGTKDYEPSSAVFGQIEDNKPWYGLKYYNCASSVHGKNETTFGDSEESRFINNPDMLVGVEQWLYDMEDYDKNPFCTDLRYTKDYKSLSYDPKTNTITAVYKRPDGRSFNFVGTNARDFGYKYVTAIGTKNIKFKEANNVSNGIYEFKDFIHTGGSCGLEGGCNNCSPHQPYLDFDLENNVTAEITFRLWRENPKSRYENADINYKIIIYTY